MTDLQLLRSICDGCALMYTSSKGSFYFRRDGNRSVGNVVGVKPAIAFARAYAEGYAAGKESVTS